jgi:endogenous inhibitor of DNA gyrase (YacG/DUF329 family)
MAGVYRQKQCPTCGITHRRRGPYCSRTCAAKDRTHSPETIEKIRESNKAAVADRSGDTYLTAADNLRYAAAMSKGRDTSPVAPRRPDNRPGETIDGDYWVSVDDWF